MIATVAVLTACATQMTAEGSKVELTEQLASHCEQVKVITVNQRLGSDKPGNAMKKALNEAGAAGANSFYVVTGQPIGRRVHRSSARQRAVNEHIHLRLQVLCYGS